MNFQYVNVVFVLYSRLRVIAQLRHEDLFHSADIISRFVLYQLVDNVLFKLFCYNFFPLSQHRV